MPYIFVITIILIFSGLIYMNRKIQKLKKKHLKKIEQLKLRVVELAEKQLVLTEKLKWERRLKKRCGESFEKLNKEVSALFDLLMKTTDKKEQPKGNT